MKEDFEKDENNRTIERPARFRLFHFTGSNYYELDEKKIFAWLGIVGCRVAGEPDVGWTTRASSTIEATNR